jgi:MFS family permease
VSTAGGALSYAVFAAGSSLTGNAALIVLLGSRLLAGICGANITVAQAYIADITPPEQRSKRMGLIGMAFGLGFIFGPALGSLSFKIFGFSGPGWVAAGLCAANFLLAIFILPESWRPSCEHVAARPRLAQWWHTLSREKVGLLIGIFFLATFCFTCFETTLGLLVSQNFHLDFKHDNHAQATIGYLFTYCGILGALVQGGAIGRLVKRMGEPKLISVSLVLVGFALVPMPFLNHWPAMLGALGFLAIGSSLARPPLFGLISILTPAREQGETIGVAQSAGSLARIVGPIFAATLFDHHPALPYAVCGSLSLLVGIFAWQSLLQERPIPAEHQRAER